MLNLEGFMNIRDLKQQGWTVSAIADELHLDRKTVRKHLLDAPQPYKRENRLATRALPAGSLHPASHHGRPVPQGSDLGGNLRPLLALREAAGGGVWHRPGQLCAAGPADAAAPRLRAQQLQRRRRAVGSPSLSARGHAD